MAASPQEAVDGEQEEAGVGVAAPALLEETCACATTWSWADWSLRGHRGGARRTGMAGPAEGAAGEAERGCSCPTGSRSRRGRRSVAHSAVTPTAVDGMKMLRAWKRA